MGRSIMGCGASSQPSDSNAPAGSNAPADSPKDAGTLVYFAGFRSRGEPCRIVAAYGGITMKDELLTPEQWGERKSDKCPHLPYISKPDGSTLHETMIAPELKKLAEELGDKKFFAGDTPGYGEAFLWHNLNNIKTCCHDEVCTAVGDEAVMKKLIEYHDRFAALPGIKEYLAGRSQKCGAPGSKGQA